LSPAPCAKKCAHPALLSHWGGGWQGRVQAVGPNRMILGTCNLLEQLLESTGPVTIVRPLPEEDTAKGDSATTAQNRVSAPERGWVEWLCGQPSKWPSCTEGSHEAST